VYMPAGVHSRRGRGGARSGLGGVVLRTRPWGSVTSRVASGRSLACQPGWWSKWWWRLHNNTRFRDPCDWYEVKACVTAGGR
jgi:hypothetical protein